MAKNKKTDDYVDDGRTIASMDFETISNSHHKKKKNINYRERRQELSSLELTKREKWAIVKAMYLTLIPFVVIMFFVMFIVFFILFSIWL